jgi:hypothetical protein
LTKRTLHIGKNSIFGCYAESIGENTISHSCFLATSSKESLKDYDILIISAFAPSNKNGEYNDDLILDVLNKVTGQTIIYISTCRIGVPQMFENHYVQSKKRQEDLLMSANIGTTVVKRLPIVVPHLYLEKELQGFLRQVSENVRQNSSFVFDVSVKSTWNFVSIADVFERLSILKSENIVGSHDIELGALQNALGRTHDLSVASFGKKIVHYSVENELPNYYVQKSIKYTLEDIVNAV